MSGQLDLFVVELGGSVAAGDEAGSAVAKVTEPERVAVRRLVGRSDFQPEVPGAVFVPACDFRKVFWSFALGCACCHLLRIARLYAERLEQSRPSSPSVALAHAMAVAEAHGTPTARRLLHGLEPASDITLFLHHIARARFAEIDDDVATALNHIDLAKQAAYLFDEVIEVGFDQSYATFTRQLRLGPVAVGYDDCTMSTRDV